MNVCMYVYKDVNDKSQKKENIFFNLMYNNDVRMYINTINSYVHRLIAF